MLLTKGNRTISLPDEMKKKIQNYKKAGWTTVKPEVEPVVDPVEPIETEETDDGSDSW